MIVTLPFVLLLLDYWPLGRLRYPKSIDSIPLDSNPSIFHLVWEKMPLFILSALSSIATFLVQQSGGALGSLNEYSLSVRISNALVSYVSYIGKMIWPFHLAILYPHPGIEGCRGIPVACVYISDGIPGYETSSMVFCWMALVHGNTCACNRNCKVGLQGMADRYTYVPLIGIIYHYCLGSF